MRIVLDTNVFVSAVFFGGPPRRILEAWRDGRLIVVLSPEILEEYQRVGDRLAELYDPVDLGPFLRLLVAEGEFAEAEPMPERVTADPDDEKFFACARTAGVSLVISGDRHLLSASGWGGIEVVPPAELVERLLRK